MRIPKIILPIVLKWASGQPLSTEDVKKLDEWIDRRYGPIPNGMHLNRFYEGFELGVGMGASGHGYKVTQGA